MNTLLAPGGVLWEGASRPVLRGIASYNINNYLFYFILFYFYYYFIYTHSTHTTTHQVQTEYQQGASYYDGVYNRTRFDDAASGQIIVTLYAVGREMLVDSDLVCQEYCPVEGDLGPNPFWNDPAGGDSPMQDLGSTTIDGVVAEHYRYFEELAHVVKMAQIDLYLTLPLNPAGLATPVHQTQLLEPFGQPVGTANSAWTNFVAGQPDPALFNVSGIRDCPMSQNCGQSAYQFSRLRQARLAEFYKFRNVRL